MNAHAQHQLVQQLTEEMPSRKQIWQKLYNLAGKTFAWSFVVLALFAGYLLSLFFFGEAYFYGELAGPGNEGTVIVMRREYKYRTVAQLYIPAAWSIGRAIGSPVHLTVEDDTTFYFSSHDDQQ